MFVAGVLFLSGCQERAKQNATTHKHSGLPVDFKSEIEDLIQGYVDLGIFSGVVLVMDQGDPLFHKAYGLADRETGRMVRLNTLFDIGSMNKTFTSIVIRQLASEGVLSLSDPLAGYLGNFSDPRAADITLTHLLEHRSGFGDYHSEGYFDLPMAERQLQAIVERAKKEILEFDPGMDKAYSNLGYVMLGAVIERATGNSYFEEVHKRIVEPLGLSDTYLKDFEGLQDRMAKGYWYTPLGDLEVSAPIQDVPNPDGGFLSTALDIAKFYRAYYYGDVLLSEDAREQDPMLRQIRSLPAGRAIGAAGGFEGFNSVLLQLVNEHLTIVVLANMDEPVAERIGAGILAIYRREQPDKPVLPAVQNVRIQYEANGIEYIREHFEELIENFHPTDPKDWILNTLGYAYLYGAEDTETALEFFKLNTELFPNVPNCHDSYGEALRAKGDLAGAKQAYTRALELDPNLETARKALREIEKES